MINRIYYQTKIQIRLIRCLDIKTKFYKYVVLDKKTKFYKYVVLDKKTKLQIRLISLIRCYQS